MNSHIFNHVTGKAICGFDAFSSKAKFIHLHTAGSSCAKCHAKRKENTEGFQLSVTVKQDKIDVSIMLFRSGSSVAYVGSNRIYRGMKARPDWTAKDKRLSWENWSKAPDHFVAITASQDEMVLQLDRFITVNEKGINVCLLSPNSGSISMTTPISQDEISHLGNMLTSILHKIEALDA